MPYLRRPRRWRCHSQKQNSSAAYIMLIMQIALRAAPRGVRAHFLIGSFAVAVRGPVVLILTLRLQ